MIPSEWVQIAATIADRWPHAAADDATLRRWGADLSDLDAGQVAASIEALYRDGREFPPNPGVVRAKLTELALDVPEWSDVLRELRRALSRPTRALRDGHHEERDGVDVYVADEVNPRAEYLATVHPMVRAFHDSLDVGQLAGAEREATGGDESRLREKWTAFARGIARDVRYQGIPDAGLPALKRANEPHAIGAGVAAVRRVLEEGEAA